MLAKRSILIAFLLLAGTVAARQQSANHFDGNSWWAHVKVLADDNMEGRETGSPGLKRAEAYAVDQFSKAGLQPAGADGFYQPVKLTSRAVVEKDSAAELIRKGKSTPLVLGEDAYFSARTEDSPEGVNAPLVFVGYGLKIPESNYDDLAGVNLKNKIAVYIAGSPSEIPGPLSAHYQSGAERWKSLKAAGAIGTVAIPNPASMDIPWSRMSVNRTHASMVLAGSEFNESAGLKIAMTFNPARTDNLFAASGHKFSDIAALAKDRKHLPHFPLRVSLKAHAAIESKPVESANLVAKLPGNDPALKDEYVVLSAHIDHLGIGQPINGDNLYNGAMDNAAGSAVVMDIAASWNQRAEQLRRSVLFVLVTGEEKGELGSTYFAKHPTVPAKSIVADVNIDMFLPIVPMKVLTVQGLAESNLGELARAAAKAFNVPVQPDPEPLRNRFIRSDQYSFIRQGIPSVKLDVGFVPGTPEQKIFKDWLTERYHAPSDDLSQPVDLATAGAYEDIVRQLLISIANTDARPRWNADSFFRRFAVANGRDEQTSPK